MLLFPFCVFVLCCSTVLSGYCNVSLHSFGILGVMKLHHFAWHSPFKDHGPRKPRSHCVDTVKHFDTAFSSEVLNVGEINLWNCLNFASNYFKKPTRFIPFSGFQVCQSFGIWMFHLASTTFLSQVPYYLREIINNIIVFLVCTVLKLQILVFSLLIYDLCTSHLGRKSICYFLKSHNTPLSPPPPHPPPKKKKKFIGIVFLYLLGHFHVPGEIGNYDYTKFWAVNEVNGRNLVCCSQTCAENLVGKRFVFMKSSL